MENKIVVKVEKVNDVLVTTSNRVAEELEVRHDHLLRKIDDYVCKFGNPTLGSEFYIESTYENRGKQYRNYLITEKGIAQLIGGYSSAVAKAFDLNVAYINEFERMKNAIQQIGEKEKLLLGLFSNDPMVVAESHKQLLALETKPLVEKIEEQAPKVEYHDLVLQSDKLLTTTQIAKDLSMSAVKLNKILHEKGILYKKSNTWFFYDKYQDKIPKYADYVIGENFQQLKWTELGRKWIIDLLKK